MTRLFGGAAQLTPYKEHCATYLSDSHQGFFKTKTRRVHAELQIIDYLLSMNAIDMSKKHYYGISKRCCLNCECAIKAINFVKKGKIITDDLEENSAGIFCRDVGSGEPYPAMCPPFLSDPNNSDIKAEFLRLTQEKSLDSAFKQRPIEKVNIENLLHAASSEYGRSDSPSRSASF